MTKHYTRVGAALDEEFSRVNRLLYEQLRIERLGRLHPGHEVTGAHYIDNPRGVGRE